MSTTIISIAILIFGLILGSFLNVIIYRLPLMLFRDWHLQCTDFLRDHPQKPGMEKFNLCLPASHCPHCKTPLKIWHNIPVISYFWQKGQCAFCEQSIPWRYPLVEGLCALVFVLVYLQFGLSWQTLASLILSATLIAGAFIDYQYTILPDPLTLPLVWLGLICNSFGLFVPLTDAVYGAIAGYLSLWCLGHVFRLLTGKEGIGYGDYKLLAVFGAWLGWQALPMVLLLSAGAGAIISLSLIALKKIKKSHPIPFGPYLAIAGWLCLLYGNFLIFRF